MICEILGNIVLGAQQRKISLWDTTIQFLLLKNEVSTFLFIAKSYKNLKKGNQRIRNVIAA